MSEVYEKRLLASLDWAYRTEEGRFLLQHIVGMCDLFNAGGSTEAELLSAGRRSIAIQLLSDIDRCRNGLAIKKTIMCDLIDERGKSSDVETEEYDPLADPTMGG